MKYTINRAMIRAAMIQRGVSQADIARKLDVSPPAVSSFFRGLNDMNPRNMGLLCEMLGLDVGDVVKWEE